MDSTKKRNILRRKISFKMKNMNVEMEELSRKSRIKNYLPADRAQRWKCKVGLWEDEKIQELVPLILNKGVKVKVKK